MKKAISNLVPFLLILSSVISCGWINLTNHPKILKAGNSKNVKYEFYKKVTLTAEFDKTVYSIEDTINIKFIFKNISKDTINILPMGIFMLPFPPQSMGEPKYLTATFDSIPKSVYINDKVDWRIIKTLLPNESVEIFCRYSDFIYLSVMK